MAALKKALSARSSDPAWRIGLAYAGPDPREALRAAVPDADEIAAITARLDRLDASSPYGPWTRETLDGLLGIAARMDTVEKELALRVHEAIAESTWELGDVQAAHDAWMRWIASTTTKAAMPKSAAPFTNAARISHRR